MSTFASLIATAGFCYLFALYLLIANLQPAGGTRRFWVGVILLACGSINIYVALA